VAWSVILEPPGGVAMVVSSHRKKEDADRKAARLARQYRFKGEQRPRVYLQRASSSDQLQTYAHGTKAHRDQPAMPAIGQDVTIFAPPATVIARAPNLGGQ
jgi:hypothetical protein